MGTQYALGIALPVLILRVRHPTINLGFRVIGAVVRKMNSINHR